MLELLNLLIILQSSEQTRTLKMATYEVPRKSKHIQHIMHVFVNIQVFKINDMSCTRVGTKKAGFQNALHAGIWGKRCIDSRKIFLKKSRGKFQDVGR